MSKYISNNKQIAKNTLFLYIRMFLTMTVSLYTVRIVVKTLTVQDYGLYGAVGGVILSFGLITGVLTNASQRFFSVEIGKGEDGRVPETFSTLFFTYIGVASLVVLLAETVGLWFLRTHMIIPDDRMSAAVWVYQFGLFSFIITLLTNPFNALIIAHEKMNVYAYISILDVILKLLIVYILVILEYDKLKMYALLMFCSQCVVNSVYIGYCRYKYHKDTRLLLSKDKHMYKSIFSYSSWTLFGTIAGMFNTQGMNILLNVFFGPLANAAYSIASQVYHTVSLFATNFYTAVKPALMKNYASANFDYVQKLFLFSSKAIFILLSVIILPLIVCTNQILLIWLGEVGEYMVAFVRLSLIYTLILTISYPITAVVQAGGFVKLYHGIVDGFSIIALPVVFILFKMGFQAYWAYLTSIIVFFIAHILRVYILKKVFDIFRVREYVLCFGLPTLLIVIGSVTMMLYLKSFFDESLISTLLVCFTSSFTLTLISYFVLLSSHEREMVKKIFNK